MALQVIKDFSVKYPIVRGMVLYAVLWPSADITQQVLIQGKKEIDFKQTARFGLYGCFYTAPTLYLWVRLSGKIIQGKKSFAVGIKKAAIEQISWAPFAISSFLVGMGALEGRTLDHIGAEFQQKFFSTWKAGICIWPFVQTINFAYIPERNRVLFTGIFSFLWTCFLSYVKEQEVRKKNAITNTNVNNV